ncbi:tetratricopeptide repeat protein [Opitutales bacterium]|jgi:tetratricopeptide (TPR) repeat protein|nr:tetratricopeptide repeat protein [Opitutales bacterium]
MSERISLFLKKLEDNKGSLLNRFSLAQAFFEEGEYNQAIPHLKECVQGRADWMMAYLFLAKAYIANGQEEFAREPLDVTIKLAQEQSHEDPENEAKALLFEINKGN